MLLISAAVADSYVYKVDSLDTKPFIVVFATTNGQSLPGNLPPGYTLYEVVVSSLF